MIPATHPDELVPKAPAGRFLRVAGPFLLGLNLAALAVLSLCALLARYECGAVRQQGVALPALSRAVAEAAWPICAALAALAGAAILLHRRVKNLARRLLAEIVLSLLLSAMLILMVLALFLPYLRLLESLE